MGITATRSAEALRVSATRLQVHLYLKAAGVTGGLEDSTITALAAAAGGEAADRLSMGTVFWSDDPFLVAAAPSLGISDLRAAILAASQL